MARSRSRSHGRRHSRRQRGGNWTSGTTYGSYVNGTGPAQFERNFSLASPYADSTTTYVGAQGQNYVPRMDAKLDLNLIQSAGRKKKLRRGGFLGPIVSQAIVPATILGLQQTYRRRGNSANKTHRRRRFSRRR